MVQSLGETEMWLFPPTGGLSETTVPLPQPTILIALQWSHQSKWLHLKKKSLGSECRETLLLVKMVYITAVQFATSPY